MILYQLSQLSRQSEPVAEIISLIDAVRLAKLNARPRTICALTGISLKKSKEIISSIQGSQPQKGRNLENPENYIKNKKHRRHVSSIISAYRKCIQFGIPHTSAIINAYSNYLETLHDFTDNRSYIDIDHIYFLIIETNKKIDFDMVQCKQCRCHFFYYKYELPLICPFCTDLKSSDLSESSTDNHTKSA